MESVKNKKKSVTLKVAYTKMGGWGVSSYDNDTTMDIIASFVDGNLVQNREYMGTLDGAAIMDKTFGLDYPGEDNLGVVVYLLEHGTMVPRVYIEKALDIARALVYVGEYKEWTTSAQARKKRLNWEIELLEVNLPIAPGYPTTLPRGMHGLPPGLAREVNAKNSKRGILTQDQVEKLRALLGGHGGR